MSYGSYLLGFGISFVQATVVAIIGIILSFMLCGLVAIAGKRGSAPTMVLSRAAFGVHGQKVPGVVSWLTSIGWETVLADRKSTRLNSSHVAISYAVFCLK